MIELATPRRLNRERFAENAAKHGAKGGSARTAAKKAASQESLKKARYAKLVKMAEAGKLFAAVKGDLCAPCEAPCLGSASKVEKFLKKHIDHRMICASKEWIPKPF